MSGVDPFEVLRQANPADPDELPGEDSPQGQALLEAILRGPRRRRAREWLAPLVLRRPRRRYLVPAVAILALSAGAVGWALTRAVTEPLTIGCYGAADLAAETAVVPADGRAPIVACREEVWERGEFGGQSPPALQACVLPSGAVGVFPKLQQDACGALGLPPVPTTYEPSSNPAIRLKDRLVEKFLSQKCLTEQEARTLVEAEFDRLRLQDWRVDAAAPFTPARPCATLAFDTPQRIVLLVPGPRP